MVAAAALIRCREQGTLFGDHVRTGHGVCSRSTTTMLWLGRRTQLWRSALSSVSPVRTPVPVRAFTSRVGTDKPKGVRTLSTTASLGFSLLGLFSARSVSDVLGTSESSSIVREASPAAITKQPYTLVFVSSTEWGVPRDKCVFPAYRRWQSWILYFREQGYDCIDLKVECPNERPEGKSPQDLLAARTSLLLTQKFPSRYA